jgi:hypothetical protein
MLNCPSCRKPLPKCSLCLLSMGCINPYLQLQYETQHRKGLVAVKAGGGADAGAGVAEEPDSEVATDRNAMPFADWWTWCQSCRHGGHATHLAEVRCARRCFCCRVRVVSPSVDRRCCRASCAVVRDAQRVPGRGV